MHYYTYSSAGCIISCNIHSRCKEADGYLALVRYNTVHNQKTQSTGFSEGLPGGTDVIK